MSFGLLFGVLLVEFGLNQQLGACRGARPCSRRPSSIRWRSRLCPVVGYMAILALIYLLELRCTEQDGGRGLFPSSLLLMAFFDHFHCGLPGARRVSLRGGWVDLSRSAGLPSGGVVTFVVKPAAALVAMAAVFVVGSAARYCSGGDCRLRKVAHISCASTDGVIATLRLRSAVAFFAYWVLGSLYYGARSSSPSSPVRRCLAGMVPPIASLAPLSSCPISSLRRSLPDPGATLYTVAPTLRRAMSKGLDII